MSQNSRLQELERKFTDWTPVLPGDYGPLYTDGRDNTATINAALAKLPSGGGLKLPRGTYYANVATTASKIRIEGESRGGTILKPYSTSLPAIAIGDGVTSVSHVDLAHLSVEGTGSGATSDGISITGAGHVRCSDFYATSFGRDNVRIGSSATLPSFHVVLSDFTSENARAACVRATYGSQYVTVVQLSNFFINGYDNASAYSLWTDCEVDAANGWFEVPNSLNGTIYLNETAGIPSPHLRCFGVHVDSSTSTDILIQVNNLATHGLSTGVIEGSASIDGKLKWLADSTVVDMRGGDSFSYYLSRMVHPQVFGALGFNNAGTSNDESEAGAELATRLYRTGATGGGSETLIVDAMDLKCTRKLKVSGTAATISSGTGTPEGAVTAPIGSLFLRTDGGAATSVYVKESGSGNTGWVGK